jgi:hypothetical protein
LIDDNVDSKERTTPRYAHRDPSEHLERIPNEMLTAKNQCRD